MLAIEDRRFYDHAGIDPIRIVGAIITNIEGDRPYLVGGSTLTQQLVKNFFLTPEKSYRRKLQEQFLVDRPRDARDQGRDPRALPERRVSRPARVVRHPRRGRSVARVLRQGRHQPVARRGRDHRGRHPGARPALAVLARHARPRPAQRRAAGHGGRRLRQPGGRRARGPRADADRRAGDGHRGAATSSTCSASTLADQYPGLLSGTQPVDIYTTLDFRPRSASRRRPCSAGPRADRRAARAQADQGAGAGRRSSPSTRGPATSSRYVGGRSYGQSQFNRAAERAAPAGLGVQAVRLPRRLRAGGRRRPHRPHPGHAWSTTSPPRSAFEDQAWTPRNYEDEYDGLDHAAPRAGAIAATWRRCKVGGDGRLRHGGRRCGSGSASARRPSRTPSIALGVVRGDAVRDGRRLHRVPEPAARCGRCAPSRGSTSGGERAARSARPRRADRRAPDTTFLVDRACCAASSTRARRPRARGMGFSHDAAGKTGTTNDLRDAWFVGFTPELLDRRVGRLRRQPARRPRAAPRPRCPSGRGFMMARPRRPPERAVSPPPDGIVFVDDRPRHRQARPARLPADASARPSSPAPSPPRRASCTGSEART
ncbi:MAG: transglycosylase domain-containing protein [Comamonadaceae bacterium]|nr:transglycosylase domain-containing protein [Comamonadaceae bacterium]